MPIHEPGTESTGITYTIDGLEFLSDYGVYVTASKGMQDMPPLKEPQIVDWPDSHGTVVDLAAPRYTNRIIELECFMKASGKLDFFRKINTFLNAFQKPGLRRLDIRITDKPLIYMVYIADGVNIDKRWYQHEMFGTFTLKLVEPSPVKRLYVRTGITVSMTITTQNPIDIYWGDDKKTLNVFGNEVYVTHDYAGDPGPHFILLCGVIEEIKPIITNAEEVWNKY
ncbi:hypothetical protein [Emticicia fluvialis]|uniref:hypothetical protein n=1 Tax=Emticicia fluvialis TaxID=2974474 RepID=UPI002166BDC9|nr:hypothetical protein [Emticicia fluvialis]